MHAVLGLVLVLGRGTGLRRIGLALARCGDEAGDAALAVERLPKRGAVVVADVHAEGVAAVGV